MASLWIDDFAGHFGTVVILGAMLAGSLYWLLVHVMVAAHRASRP